MRCGMMVVMRKWVMCIVMEEEGNELDLLWLYYILNDYWIVVMKDNVDCNVLHWMIDWIIPNKYYVVEYHPAE